MKNIVYIILIWTAHAVVSASGSCVGAPASNESELVSSGASGVYSLNEHAVYECHDKMGVMTRVCQGNDSWTEPSRSCHDGIALGYATMGGIGVAAFTYLVGIFMACYSSFKIVVQPSHTVLVPVYSMALSSVGSELTPTA